MNMRLDGAADLARHVSRVLILERPAEVLQPLLRAARPLSPLGLGGWLRALSAVARAAGTRVVARQVEEIGDIGRGRERGLGDGGHRTVSIIPSAHARRPRGSRRSPRASWAVCEMVRLCTATLLTQNLSFHPVPLRYMRQRVPVVHGRVSSRLRVDYSGAGLTKELIKLVRRLTEMRLYIRPQ